MYKTLTFIHFLTSVSGILNASKGHNLVFYYIFKYLIFRAVV